MSEHKRKIPLPGYRFLFMTFGSLLSLGSLWIFYSGFSKPNIDDSYIKSGLWGGLWIAVGVLYIWYSVHLRRETLTKRDWILGFFIMAAGALTGIGIPVLFMILIWTDADVRAVFKPKNAA